MILLNSVLWLYILAAILPAVALLIYVYKKDRGDKEPGGLLLKCIAGGLLSTVIAIILEQFGTNLLNGSTLAGNSFYYIVADAFLVVALSEEFSKMLFLKWFTWKNPNFNYSFDGLIYSIFVSLGFAALENILYVFNYGLSVALPRAFLSIPGHMTFAVIMGVFYSKAKICQRQGKHGTGLWLITAWLSATFLHGFYDACAMLGTTEATLVFYAFVIFMYVFAFGTIKKMSREDKRI